MSDRPLPREIFEEMHQRLMASLGGASPAEPGRRLDELIRQNIDACDLYLDLVFEASVLRAWAKNGVRDGSFGPSKETHCVTPTVVAAKLPNAAGYFSFGWPTAYLISALLLCVGLFIGSLFNVSCPDQTPIARQSAPFPSSTDHRPPASDHSEFIGRVTGMVDCAFSDKTTATFSGAYFSAGRRFALSAGLMEVTYDAGAKVILQGPCTYEVESAAGGFLTLGKLTARVEKKQVASGQWSVASEKSRIASVAIPNPQIPKSPNPLFSVRTPTAIVTDLGTEFGVEVGADRATKTRVFAGRVEVKLSEPGNLSSKPQIVTAGQTVQTSADKRALVMLTDDRSKFVCQMPRPLQRQNADEYAKLVLAMQPAVYYRMERPKNASDRLVASDSAPGGHHGALTADMDWPWLPGRFGDALFCRESGGCQAVIVPDYPKATADQLSFSAWVLAESRPYWAIIANNWKLSEAGQFMLSLYDYDGDLVVTTKTLQKNPTWQKTLLLVREGKDHPFPLFQWQHVAFVCDRTVLRLYRNGAEAASMPCDGLRTNPEIPSLMIGGRADDKGKLRPFQSWHGRIDEVAVFNRALSPDEIRQLAKPTTKRSESADGAATDAAAANNNEGPDAARNVK